MNIRKIPGGKCLSVHLIRRMKVKTRYRRWRTSYDRVRAMVEDLDNETDSEAIMNGTWDAKYRRVAAHLNRIIEVGKKWGIVDTTPPDKTP